MKEVRCCWKEGSILFWLYWSLHTCCLFCPGYYWFLMTCTIFPLLFMCWCKMFLVILTVFCFFFFFCYLSFFFFSFLFFLSFFFLRVSSFICIKISRFKQIPTCWVCWDACAVKLIYAQFSYAPFVHSISWMLTITVLKTVWKLRHVASRTSKCEVKEPVCLCVYA